MMSAVTREPFSGRSRWSLSRVIRFHTRTSATQHITTQHNATFKRSPMTLDAEVVEMILKEVARHTQERVIPSMGAWDKPASTATMQALDADLKALGLLKDTLRDQTPTMWSAPDSTSVNHMSTQALRLLARGSVAHAFSCHRKALTNWLLEQFNPDWADIAASSRIVLAPYGHHGLARSNLGSWLAHPQRLSDDDALMLADWLDHDRFPVSIWSLSDWQHVLWPVWQNGCIQWVLRDRNTLQITRQLHPHGLEELAIEQVKTHSQIHRHAMPCTTLSIEQSSALYASLLKMDMLGLSAIGLGVLERGADIAREFAAVRRQGGKVIAQHAAVMNMLAEMRIAIESVHTMLLGVMRPLSEIELPQVAAIRERASTCLMRATHQVMQVHGGVGYMRDVGPEKLVRDQHMLRVAAGGVMSTKLLIAGWETTP